MGWIILLVVVFWLYELPRKSTPSKYSPSDVELEGLEAMAQLNSMGNKT